MILPVVAFFASRPWLVRVLVLNVAAPMLAGYWLVQIAIWLTR